MKRFKRTEYRERYLRRKKFNIESIWECEYHQLKKTLPDLNQLNLLPPFTKKHAGPVSEDSIIDAVLNDQLFGMVEVDISVS